MRRAIWSAFLLLAACRQPDTTDAGERFGGPITLDDDRVRNLDPSTLPAGGTPCRAPVLMHVTRNVDGDTFDATPDVGGPEERVRFIGVNSPEIMHPPDPTPAQCYGDAAATFSAQLGDHLVWLTFDNECLDTYGRTLAYIFIGSEQPDFWERQLLTRGFAQVLTVGNNRTYAPVFEGDQAQARSELAGEWTACP